MPDDFGFLEDVIEEALKKKKTKEEYCINCSCKNCEEHRKSDEAFRKKMITAAVIASCS